MKTKSDQKFLSSFCHKLRLDARSGIFQLIAVLGLLLSINALTYINPVRWDVTDAQIFSLSPRTKDILAQLDQPISAQAFLSSSYSSIARVERLLDNFTYQAPIGFFTYEVIDPETNPVLAQQANALKDGSILLTNGTHTEQITFISEQELTSAILRLMTPIEKNIYFLMGHGEYEPQGTDTYSYGFVQQALTAKNYTVGQINLLTTGRIPNNASSIIIADPQEPLLEGEIALLDDYLESGGNLVVLLEPTISTGITSDDDLLGEYLSNRYGIAFQQDVILDPSMQPPVIAIAEYYGEHPITVKLAATATIFPTVRSLFLLENNSSTSETCTQLVLTSGAAWGETSEDEIISGEPLYTQGQDFQGPLLIALSCENMSTGGKVVIVGDSDFGSNAYFQEYANGDLIVNIIEWTASITDDTDISTLPQIERVLVPPSTISLGAILLVTVFVIPSAFIIAGINALLKQRKKTM